MHDILLSSKSEAELIKLKKRANGFWKWLNHETSYRHIGFYQTE